MSPASSTRTSSSLRGWLGAALLAVLLFAVVRAVLPEWRQIDWQSLSIRPGALLGSAAALVLARLCHASAFGRTLAALDSPLPTRSLLAPIWGAALANYLIPTKLVSATGLALILHRRGVALQVGAQAILISSLLTVIVALAIGAPAVFGATPSASTGPESIARLPGVLALAGGALLATLSLLHPRVVRAVVNPILNRLGQPRLSTTLRWRPFAAAVAWTALHVALRALALGLAVLALAPPTPPSAVTMLTTSGLAIGAGSLAFFAPAGLGVHEAIYLIGLEPSLGPMVALLLIVFRLLVTAVDVASAGAAIALDRAGDPERGDTRQPPAPGIVAVANVAGIGNSLLSQPLVAALRRHFPSSRILVVSRTRAMAEVYQRMPEVDDVWVCRGGLAALVRMHWRLRRLQPDVYLVPSPSNRWEYVALAVLSGARTRILHRYPIGHWAALRVVPARYVPAQRELHDVVQNLNLLTGFGLLPDSPSAPEFALRPEDRRRAADWLRDHGIEGGFIAVHPGSASHRTGAAKRWPAERYRALIDGLLEAPGLPVIVLEGPDERGVGDDILRGRMPSHAVKLELAGPLAECAAVLERARLYVGQDSGLAHLAAAVGCPAIALFGPGDPDRVCPYGYRHFVQQPDTPGARPAQMYPYDSTRSRLRALHAMRVDDIPVEQVQAAVRQALDSSPTAPGDEPAG